MKHLKLFENFEIAQPLIFGDPLNQKEINFLKEYNVMCPEWILKDDNYYYVFDHRCEKIKDLPTTYIHAVCKKFNILNTGRYHHQYNINDDFTVWVGGHVDFKSKDLNKIPLKFNKVTGLFDCSFNNLTTLEGSPKWAGDFDCDSNRLTTLKGGPEYVQRNFSCRFNKLRSLKGAPKYIGYYFNFEHNPALFMWLEVFWKKFKGTIKGRAIPVMS
jgi:hypothetical protein